MFQELPDPFANERTHEILWQRLRPFLGRQKRRMFPWLVSRFATPPPVIGFERGASGPLRRRALLVYLVDAFHSPNPSLVRTNARQSLEIASALNRLGYVVDVVDCRDETFEPDRRYDVCIGMHHGYGRLLPRCKAEGTFTIYYGTGAYWQFEMAAEAARCRDLLQRRGVEIRLPLRLGPNDWVQMSDAVIALGNEFVAQWYRPHNSRVFPLDHVALTSADVRLDAKNFAAARRHFLFFVGTGLLHKGMDLVLEAFAGLDDVHLWVCGQLNSGDERQFTRAYRRELYHTPNIHPVGFIGGAELDRLSEQCLALIHPSCSEGMPGAVLDGMARGLIPVLSRESGVDTDDFGVTLDPCSVGEVQRQVRALSRISAATARQMSERARATVCRRYTFTHYRHNVDRILGQVLPRA